eukprot:1159871-Pelagomonas_calceolata.AAC.7
MGPIRGGGGWWVVRRAFDSLGLPSKLQNSKCIIGFLSSSPFDYYPLSAKRSRLVPLSSGLGHWKGLLGGGFRGVQAKNWHDIHYFLSSALLAAEENLNTPALSRQLKDAGENAAHEDMLSNSTGDDRLPRRKHNERPLSGDAPALYQAAGESAARDMGEVVKRWRHCERHLPDSAAQGTYWGGYG